MIYLEQFVNLQEERNYDLLSYVGITKLSVFDIIKNIENISGEFVSKFASTQNSLHIGKNTYVSDKALIGKNVYIGNNCKIYDYACIRNNTIILDDVLIGHCSEVGRSILFSGAWVTHKAAMGDSIMGRDSHLTANVCLASPSLFNKKLNIPHNSSNKLTKTIKIETASGEKYDTKLAKFGSVIGDNCKIGVNSSLGPGVLLGSNSIVYPNIFLRGKEYLPRTIIKLKQSLAITSKLK